jgi:hypothetical protein
VLRGESENLLHLLLKHVGEVHIVTGLGL